MTEQQQPFGGPQTPVHRRHRRGRARGGADRQPLRHPPHHRRPLPPLRRDPRRSSASSAATRSRTRRPGSTSTCGPGLAHARRRRAHDLLGAGAPGGARARGHARRGVRAHPRRVGDLGPAAGPQPACATAGPGYNACTPTQKEGLIVASNTRTASGRPTQAKSRSAGSGKSAGATKRSSSSAKAKSPKASSAAEAPPAQPGGLERQSLAHRQVDARRPSRSSSASNGSGANPARSAP